MAIAAALMLAGLNGLALPDAASAQQAATGLVTTVDRINGTIAIQQTDGATQSYQAKADMLETLHAGDRVTFSATEANGKKTIAKIDKQ